MVNQIVGFDGTTNQQYLLGDGPWHDCPYFSLQPGAPFLAGNLLNYTAPALPSGLQYLQATRPDYFHFHRGDLTPIGLPLNLISFGPDQGSENWLQYYPSVTPALCYSGIAYYVARAVVGTSPTNITVSQLQPIGIYRTTHCRIFDASGNVTGYGFTCNPTWQMIETMLRFRYKRQQPGLAGLTSSELALFDWPAMVAHAERNATILANGQQRFVGNFAFAADTTLDAMMEAQLRNCRSFRRMRGSVLSFVGDDARASVFIATNRAVVPESVDIDNKDVSTAPNVIVAQYRDLQIPAVAQVLSVQTPSPGQSTFTTIGSQPFFSSDYFSYSGGSNDAAFAGDYRVKLYLSTTTGTSTGETIAPPIPNQFNANGGAAAAGSAIGGFLGTQQSRFKPRNCRIVQHRAHQAAFAAIAPGVTGLAQPSDVVYDFGNNTFDQTNRLAQWIKIRDLGPDVTPYVAPPVGSVTLFRDAVDANGACAAEIEPGDVITLDDTVTPEFAGEFVVEDGVTFSPAAKGNLATVKLPLKRYQPTAYTDASDPVDSSFKTLPGNLLSMADDLLPNPNFVMQATPYGGIAADGTITIVVPDLSIWWAGQTSPTAYASMQVTGVPANTSLTLYLTVTNSATTPTLSIDTVSAYPPVPLPAGKVVLYYGAIQALPTGYVPPAPVGTKPPITHLSLPAAGGLTAAILTPSAGYFVGTPVTSTDTGDAPTSTSPGIASDSGGTVETPSLQ